MSEKRIKVLYVHHHGTAGGASSSLRYLIKNFPKDTVDPYILTPPGTAVDFFKSVSNNVLIIPELPQIISVAGGKFQYIRLIKTFLSLRAINAVKKHIREIKPDILHFNELSLGLVAKECKRMGYRVVMHARVVLSEEVAPINWLIKNLIRKHVDHLIAIDGSVAGKLAGAGKIDIVHNPLHVDTSFQIDRKMPEEGTCTCLFLSNLLYYKGLFDLLDAALLLKDQPGIKILIAGANSRPSAFFKSFHGRILAWLGIVSDNEEKVRQIIAKNDLSNVSFLGYVKDINSLLQRTDVLLFPSHMNGPSRSIFEAGALGIPSILALKDKVQDVLIHEENGLIIPEKSPQLLADSIRTLASNSALREKLGESARHHFNYLNDPRRSAENVLRVYREVLQED